MTDPNPSLQKSRALLVTSQPEHCDAILGAARQWAQNVEIISLQVLISGNSAADVLLCDFDSFSNEEKDSFGTQILAIGSVWNSTPIVVLSRRGAQSDFSRLFQHGMLTNLVAADSEASVWDLHVTMDKLVSDNIFGIERYFSDSRQLHSWKLNSSSEKNPLLAEIEAKARETCSRDRLVSHLVSVAEEFLSNALYDAPVDVDGNSLYRHLARSIPVASVADKPVEVLLAYDENRMGISVSDHYGSLTPKVVLNYLSKCFRKEAEPTESTSGGAGIGLYLSFESLSHLVINIHSNHRTEMIGMITTSGSFKKFAQTGKSFNLFVKSEREPVP